MSSLEKYSKKRRFTKTPEPGPEEKHSESGNIFVVQKHKASQLHYDFRLEADGVLKSWAVPKGPSTNPSTKRLAVEVEDHPVEYANFEGLIPHGEYGGGTVMIWDHGTYEPQDDDVTEALIKGQLKFTLKGKKLKGSWVLIRTKDRQWLLIKHRDRYASESEPTRTAARSVISGLTLAQIARIGGSEVAKVTTERPPKPKKPKVSRSRGSGKPAKGS